VVALVRLEHVPPHRGDASLAVAGECDPAAFAAAVGKFRVAAPGRTAVIGVRVVDRRFYVALVDPRDPQPTLGIDEQRLEPMRDELPVAMHDGRRRPGLAAVERARETDVSGELRGSRRRPRHVDFAGAAERELRTILAFCGHRFDDCVDAHWRLPGRAVVVRTLQNHLPRLACGLRVRDPYPPRAIDCRRSAQCSALHRRYIRSSSEQNDARQCCALHRPPPNDQRTSAIAVRDGYGCDWYERSLVMLSMPSANSVPFAVV
jgi:hypothetical protein